MSKRAIDIPCQIEYNVFAKWENRKQKGGLIMSVFDEIKTGLNEAIEYEKGNLKANTRTLSISKIEEFTVNEIKTITNETSAINADI